MRVSCLIEITSNYGDIREITLKRFESLLKKFDVAERLIIEINLTVLKHDVGVKMNYVNGLHKYGCVIGYGDFREMMLKRFERLHNKFDVAERSIIEINLTFFES